MLILKKEGDDDVMTTGPGAGGRQNTVCYNVTVHAKIKYKSANIYLKLAMDHENTTHDEPGLEQTIFVTRLQYTLQCQQ